jgi:hypothetical protein
MSAIGATGAINKKKSTARRRSSTVRLSSPKPVTARLSSPKKVSTPQKVSSVKKNSTQERYNAISEHINKHILKTACAGADSRMCLAFGTFTPQIKSYFAGFNTFQYATAVRLLGKPSVNGFVNEIEYEREGFADAVGTYKSYAILKSSQKAKADNLMYEYRVGQYINKFNRLYPCFLETYGLLKYNSIADWEQMQKKEKDISVLQGLSIQPVDYAVACKKSLQLAILIQHFNHFTALEDFMQDAAFIEKELMYILFQLYIPLAQMKETFTHYDMHLNNLYLYEPAPGKYIQYHYYLTPGGAPVSFKSKYMLKIIDYGRSYFKDTTEDSQSLYDNKICKIPACNTAETNRCGYNVGFQWLMTMPEENKYKRSHHLNAHKKNESYDLWPLSILKRYYMPELTPELIEIMKKLSYEGIEKKSTKADLAYADLLTSSPPPTSIYNRLFTRTVKLNKPAKTASMSKPTSMKTKKSTKRDVNVLPKLIFTVQDSANYFVSYITRPDFIEANRRDHMKEKKFGDLHVYLDGTPMVFDMDGTSEV